MDERRENPKQKREFKTEERIQNRKKKKEEGKEKKFDMVMEEREREERAYVMIGKSSN